MAYVTSDETKKTITWDSNPYVGGESRAVIVDGVVTEYVVTDANFVSAIYSKDPVYLAHLRDTISDLLIELNPA